MPVLLVVALATALRVAWVLVVPTKPVGDFAMYLESATHVVEHGALDPEYVYMPGYVFFVAAVQALGGGLLATKLAGALLSGSAAGAVFGIAERLSGKRAGIAAGLLYALWPGGIVVASVTGTDMPTGALVAWAIFFLVRDARDRPLRATIAFGLAMGLAAWVRAVAVPLAAFAAFYFFALRAGLALSLRRGALAALVAGAVLAPWAVRNGLRYGEVFLTDSHGGLTALVGANPNSDGRYSRSLNRVFRDVTGFTLLAEPHREADRASYALAKDWTAFEPIYALGLVVAKLERLLAHERSLLYWPVYRAGVLPEAARAPFDAWRREIELALDAFWALLVGAAAFGIGVALARGRWEALSLLAFPVCLVAIYALFFAEVRYHLPIATLLFPFAGAALVWLGGVFSRGARPEGRRLAREAGIGAACVVALFGGWAALVAIGERLREGHRFAAHVCEIAGAKRACKWRVAFSPSPASGVQGVWNGVGVALPGPQPRPEDERRSAETEIPLPPGRYDVEGALDLAPAPADLPAGGTATLSIVGGAPLASVPLGALARGEVHAVRARIEHAGGPLRLRLEAAARGGWPATAPPLRLWLGDLRVSRAP